MKTAAVALSVVMVFGIGAITSHATDKCMYFATIEKDQYGAISLDAFDELQYAQRDGDKAKVNELIDKNKINLIVTDKKICVISEAFFKYSSRISIPGYPIEYWVDSRKLSKVE